MLVKKQLKFSLCDWVNEGCCIKDLVLWERRNVLFSFTIHTTVCSRLSLILNTDYVSVLNSWWLWSRCGWFLFTSPSNCTGGVFCPCGGCSPSSLATSSSEPPASHCPAGRRGKGNSGDKLKSLFYCNKGKTKDFTTDYLRYGNLHTITPYFILWLINIQFRNRDPLQL